MPGSWELRQNPPVLVAILHTELTTVAWSFGLRNLIIPGHLPPLPLSGAPYDHGRNSACAHALAVGAEYLFFLDSDVVPPRDAILRLMAHRLPIVSGVYRRRSPPIGIPVMQRRDDKGNMVWVTNIPRQGLIEVDVVGAGCLLIHTDVLKTLPPQRPEAGKTYFDWRVDCQELYASKKMPTHMPPMSEDFTFNIHAKNHGIKIMVDCGVVCRHLGSSETGPGGEFVPLKTTPIS